MGAAFGIIGLLVTSLGTLLKHQSLEQKHCFFWGAALLTIASIIDMAFFFIVLEVVVIGSAALAFIETAKHVKVGVPIGLGIAAVVLLISGGYIDGIVPVIGTVGLLALSLGFATSHPVLYLIGAIGISTFGFIRYAQEPNSIALIFGILNVIFGITSAIATWKYYRTPKTVQAA